MERGGTDVARVRSNHAQRGEDVAVATVVAYPDWPFGLGRPTPGASSHDSVAFRANASAKSRKELVAVSRAQRSRVETLASGSAHLHPAPAATSCVLRNYDDDENLQLPIRRCSSQIERCRALATRKCLSCVQFDDLQLGYYCDSCFRARHPAYRLEHNWILIEDDITEVHERINDRTRRKLDHDIQELEQLLAKTHTVLTRSHAAAPLSLQSAMPRGISTAVRQQSPPPPPSLQPSSIALRTATGELDFNATRLAIALIQGTLRGLIEHVRLDLSNTQPKTSMTHDDAVVKIQRLWKVRCARKQLTALIQSVYASYEDPTTGETYYYNRKTHTTQWTKPRAFTNATTGTSIATTPAPKRVFDSLEAQQADAAQCIQRMVRFHNARKHLRALISSVYEKIWDATSERFYYHNTKTKQVQWAKPRWVSDDDLLTPRTRQQQADDALRQRRLTLIRTSAAPDELAATILQRAYRRKRAFTALIMRCQQVYERIFDANENAYYYYNTQTQEVTWSKPAVLRHANADALTPRSRLARVLGATASRAGNAVKHAAPREWTEEQAAVCLQGLFRARQAKRALDARLAQTFRKVWDADASRFYYVDLRTQAASWDPPSLLLRSGIQVDEFA